MLKPMGAEESPKERVQKVKEFVRRSLGVEDQYKYTMEYLAQRNVIRPKEGD
jgi:hypothetical protein